jgi:hypothetical protein
MSSPPDGVDRGPTGPGARPTIKPSAASVSLEADRLTLQSADGLDPLGVARQGPWPDAVELHAAAATSAKKPARTANRSRDSFNEPP